MPEMRAKSNRLPTSDCQILGIHQRAEENSATWVKPEETIADFTLRAGGRVLNVAMLLCGGTDSHMKVLSPERLSLEQWTQLCDQIQMLAHSMILLDHPDDSD